MSTASNTPIPSATTDKAISTPSVAVATTGKELHAPTTITPDATSGTTEVASPAITTDNYGHDLSNGNFNSFCLLLRCMLLKNSQMFSWPVLRILLLVYMVPLVLQVESYVDERSETYSILVTA
jgi:hypothetical protein